MCDHGVKRAQGDAAGAPPPPERRRALGGAPAAAAARRRPPRRASGGTERPPPQASARRRAPPSSASWTARSAAPCTSEASWKATSSIGPPERRACRLQRAAQRVGGGVGVAGVRAPRGEGELDEAALQPRIGELVARACEVAVEGHEGGSSRRRVGGPDEDAAVVAGRLLGSVRRQHRLVRSAEARAEGLELDLLLRGGQGGGVECRGRVQSDATEAVAAGTTAGRGQRAHVGGGCARALGRVARNGALYLRAEGGADQVPDPRSPQPEPKLAPHLMDFGAALRFSPRWDLPRRTSATTSSAASASSQASKLSSIFCKFGRRLGLRRARRARGEVAAQLQGARRAGARDGRDPRQPRADADAPGGPKENATRLGARGGEQGITRAAPPQSREVALPHLGTDLEFCRRARSTVSRPPRSP